MPEDLERYFYFAHQWSGFSYFIFLLAEVGFQLVLVWQVLQSCDWVQSINAMLPNYQCYVQAIEYSWFPLQHEIYAIHGQQPLAKFIQLVELVSVSWPQAGQFLLDWIAHVLHLLLGGLRVLHSIINYTMIFKYLVLILNNQYHKNKSHNKSTYIDILAFSKIIRFMSQR